MTDELQAMITSIRELAKKAIPGPWATFDILGEEPIGTTRKSIFARRENDHEIHDWHIAEATYAGTEDDANYIAAVNPQAITAILDELAHLNRQADWLAERMKCDNTFTPEQEAACIAENGPCAKCLREAAKRNTA